MSDMIDLVKEALIWIFGPPLVLIIIAFQAAAVVWVLRFLGVPL